MRALLREAGRIARFDVPVLIEGETGSGKELLARYLHDRSPRRRHPLVAVNCGAVPDELLEAEFFGHARGAFTGADSARPGLLEAADGGTLFLDEVGELSPRGQGLLLRAIQEREFRRVGETRLRRSDFRLVAATHRPLADLAAAGRFRSDLFYRLRVVRALLRHPDVLVIGPEMVAGPPPVPSDPVEAPPESLLPVLEIRRLALARAAFERLVLLRALRRTAGSRARAARELGISRQGLWQKLRRHGID